MKRLKVNIILMDVDGTMTDVGGKRKTMALTPLEHLVRLVMEQYSIEADEAERKIRACGDPNLHCLSEFLPVLGIDEEQYFLSLKNDLADYISIPADTVAFLRAMKEKKIPVCMATANSLFMGLAKLAVGGIADRNGSEFITRCHPGNEFLDPLGKFSGNYYSNILRKYNYPPDMTMMIGDEPEYDLYPALKAGIRYGVIIRRNQKESILQKERGIFINSLEVLTSMIRKGA